MDLLGERRQMFQSVVRQIHRFQLIQLEENLLGNFVDLVVRRVEVTKREEGGDLIRQRGQPIVRQRQRGEMCQLSDATRQHFQSGRIAQLEEIQPVERPESVIDRRILF